MEEYIPKYYTSEHFRDDPVEEVEAALLAGNTPQSINATLEARLHTESNHTEESDRIRKQIGHLTIITSKVEILV